MLDAWVVEKLASLYKEPIVIPSGLPSLPGASALTLGHTLRGRRFRRRTLLT